MTDDKSMFPTLYHAQHSRYSEDIPLWLELAARTGGPILELGCGTGRVTFALAHAGYQVFGLDRDSQMLGFLRDNLPGSLKSRVGYFQADMAQFHLASRFKLILLPCNTYSTLSPPQRRATLGCLRRHLSPNGLFATSFPNPDLLRKPPAHGRTQVEDIFSHPDDGEPVQVSSAWRRTGGHFVIHWHYDHLLPNGTAQRVSVQVRHHLSTSAEHAAELKSAGFETIDLYGDFDLSSCQPNSQHLIILAS
jgi:SAM-dependent methyltransferase